MDIDIFKTEIGWIKIESCNNCIHSLDFVEKQTKKIHNLDLINDIRNYLSGKSTHLKSEFYQIGSQFQEKIWEAIRLIPRGHTKTYSEIAKIIGCPNSCRAVANACGQNNIALYVPCHRVVAKNGLGGYSGGIHIKKFLLKLEQDF